MGLGRRGVVMGGLTTLVLPPGLAGCARPASETSSPARGDWARLTADAAASVWRRGEGLAYAPGMLLTPRDQIQTDAANHALVAFGDGDSVYMSPGTRIEIGSIFVFFGEIFARIVSGRDVFRAESDVVSAGVERTEFLMRVDRVSRETTVIVRRGAVRCSPRRAAHWAPLRLEPNQQLVVPRSGRVPPRPVTLQRAHVAAVTQWADSAARRLPAKTPPTELAPRDRLDGTTPGPPPR